MDHQPLLFPALTYQLPAKNFNQCRTDSDWHLARIVAARCLLCFIRLRYELLEQFQSIFNATVALRVPILPTRQRDFHIYRNTHFFINVSVHIIHPFI